MFYLLQVKYLTIRSNYHIIYGYDMHHKNLSEIINFANRKRSSKHFLRGPRNLPLSVISTHPAALH